MKNKSADFEKNEMFMFVFVLLLLILMTLKKSDKKRDSDQSILQKIIFQEKYGTVFDFCRRPSFYFHKMPLLSFIIGFPAAFLFYCLNEFYFNLDSESFLLLFSFFLFLPYMYFEEIKQRKTNYVEKRMPSFLRELSEFCSAGLTLSESFEKAAKSMDSYRIENSNSTSFTDILTNEIKLMGLKMNAGISFESCLEDFGNRYDSLLICRAASIIQIAEKSGGHISLTLEAAAFDFEESVFTKLERDSKQTIYAVVLSASFLLLVGVSVLLIFQFDSMTALTQTSVLKDSYPQMNKIIFHLLFIQALFAGLMIGKLKKGNIFIGIKYSFLLMFFVWIAFIGTQKFN